MNNRFIKITAVISVLSLLFTACSSLNTKQAGQSDPSTKDSIVSEDPIVSAPGQFPICKEKITMTVGIKSDNVVKDYDTNELTKWFEEKGNFDLKFEVFLENPIQNLKLLTASNSKLPDVLSGLRISNLDLFNFAQQEAIIPLNKYYDKYGDYSKKMFAERGELKKNLTMPDGNMYSMPNYSEQTGNELSGRAWINKKWLDALGLKVPETTDEFYQVLRAFQAKDPNGNGIADEIPLSGDINGWHSKFYDFFINAFVYNDTGSRYVLNNGKLDVAYTKDEWREAMKYIAKLYKEGLVNPSAFTLVVNDQKKLMASPTPVIGVYTSGNILFTPTDSRKLDYVPLPPLKGPKGIQWTTFFDTLPLHNFVITRDAKHPLAAFRWGDLMLSEEASIRSRFGVPDVDWKVPGPNDKGMYENIGIKPKLISLLPGSDPQSSHWHEQNPAFRKKDIPDGQVFSGNVLDNEYHISLSVPFYLNKYPKDRVANLIFTSEEIDEISNIQTEINTYVNQSIKKFATGELDVDNYWDDYKQYLNNLGLKKYLDVCQKVYDRMNKK